MAFGLYFVVVGLTGSAIVFAPELSIATMPLSSGRPVNAAPLPLKTILDRIHAAYPDRIVTRIRWFPEPADRYRVSLSSRAGDDIDIYAFIERATGNILGTESRWIRWLMELHIYLLKGKTGEHINGIGALLLAIASLSGIVIWWNGIRDWTRGLKVNWLAGWKVLNYDMHRVVGAMSLVFVLVLSLSGFYYAFPAPFRAAVRFPAIPVSVVRTDLPPVNLDVVVAKAGAALPGGIVTALYLPLSSTDPFRLRVKLPGDGWEFGLSEVYIDQYSGETLGVRNLLTLPLGQRVILSMAPIHYGRFGGLLTRILWVIVGLTPTILFVSGCLMWWNRSLHKHWRRIVTFIPLRSDQPNLANTKLG
jgi:uncharacterized iron-regulated membrane protein